MSSTNDDLLTKQALANKLQCSLRHLEKLLHEGMPFVPLGIRKKMYNYQSVLNWFKSRESCLQEKTKKGAGTRKYASTANAFTEYYHQVQQKRTLKHSKQS